MAQKVKPREKLVLFLIRHGSFKAGEFHFLINTSPTTIPEEGEAFIAKDELHAALKPCQGDIFIICNARYCCHLVSEHWVLLCPGAVLGQAADAPLSNSSLGYLIGSAFTACLVEQKAPRISGVREMDLNRPQIHKLLGLKYTNSYIGCHNDGSQCALRNSTLFFIYLSRGDPFSSFCNPYTHGHSLALRNKQYVVPKFDARLVPRSFLPMFFEDVFH